MARMEQELPEPTSTLRREARSKRPMEKARANHLHASELDFRRVTASFSLREK